MASLSLVELHAALTHVPIAFLLGMAVFEAGAALFRKPEWRTVSFWLLVGAVAIAVPSLITGWITGNELKFTGSPAPPPGVFVTHRLFAFSTSGLAVLLLLWRVKAKDRFEGRASGALLCLSLLAAACVGYTGFLGGRMVFGGASTEREEAAAKPTIVGSRTTLSADPKLVENGQKLFTQLPCHSCHRMNGSGGSSGPDLTHEARRHADVSWHIAHLKDPQKMKPNSDMPPFDTLKDTELKALAAYLSTRD
jgi:uncharacterized membrane protein/cytochrome c2